MGQKCCTYFNNEVPTEFTNHPMDKFNKPNKPNKNIDLLILLSGVNEIIKIQRAFRRFKKRKNLRLKNHKNIIEVIPEEEEYGKNTKGIINNEIDFDFSKKKIIEKNSTSIKNNDHESQQINILFEDGTRYEGEWKLDKPEGKGKISFYDGSTFEGIFKNGKINGYGKCHLSNKFELEGNWHKNKLNGYGELI